MKRKKLQIERKGFIVVVVLCMIIMLAALLTGFNYKSRFNLHAIDNFRKSEQALNCAGAGLNIAMAAIKSTDNIYTSKKLPNLLSGESAFPVGEGNCLISVTEENSKLNINLLIDQNNKPNRTKTEQLLRLIDLLNNERVGDSNIGYGLVAAIIDWTDSDDNIVCLPFVKRENLGAESNYYSSLEPPYRCKNRPLDTTEELLLVKGITPQIFNRIRDYVTVKGDGKVNINCAPKRVIESLSERMDPTLAQMIIDRREIKPFDSMTEIRDIPGMTDKIYYTLTRTATVSPTERYYCVKSQGNVGKLSHKIEALLVKNIATKNVDVVLCKEL